MSLSCKMSRYTKQQLCVPAGTHSCCFVYLLMARDKLWCCTCGLHVFRHMSAVMIEQRMQLCSKYGLLMRSVKASHQRAISAAELHSLLCNGSPTRAESIQLSSALLSSPLLLLPSLLRLGLLGYSASAQLACHVLHVQSTRVSPTACSHCHDHNTTVVLCCSGVHWRRT